jgi:hypothetical protein
MIELTISTFKQWCIYIHAHDLHGDENNKKEYVSVINVYEPIYLLQKYCLNV